MGSPTRARHQGDTVRQRRIESPPTARAEERNVQCVRQQDGMVMESVKTRDGVAAILQS